MTGHNLFYYPYASFTDAQLPLLKVAALYFDKLVILDPDKATGGTVGSGDIAKDVVLLEKEGILSRIAPEEVLKEYEQDIATAIRTDLNDPMFIELCDKSGKGKLWTLALAKVPKEIRDDPQHQEYAKRKPQDVAMQQLMGDLARTVANGVFQYKEQYVELQGDHDALHNLYKERPVYDEQRLSQGREIEYRYAEYPLPIGEAIMMNHALFTGLLKSGATPITDDPFHSQVLAHKLQRMTQEPVIRQAIASRADQRKLKAAAFATTALTDAQVKLPILHPAVPLAEVLEYRQKNPDALAKVRETLGLMARRIEAEPWSADFAHEIETKTVPELIVQLTDAAKARDAWLGTATTKSWLKAAGIAVGAASAVLAVATAPVTPVALAIAGLGIVSGSAIPGTEWLLDWRDGKKTIQENGLHYLLRV